MKFAARARALGSELLCSGGHEAVRQMFRDLFGPGSMASASEVMHSQAGSRVVSGRLGSRKTCIRVPPVSHSSGREEQAATPALIAPEGARSMVHSGGGVRPGTGDGGDRRVLGRVDALVDGRSLPLGRRKQRAVLAMLALRANRTVSTDELIDGLWGERPPASAAKNVQHYVSQLRKALACRRLRGADRHPRPGLRAPAARRTRWTRRASSASSSEPGARPSRGSSTGRHRARSSCGAAPRSPTSPRSRSREPRSAASRSFTCARSSSRSTPSSRRDATTRRSAASRR